MGVKAAEPLNITAEELPTYMRSKHSAYLVYNEETYYLTDCNDIYWRLQDTTILNEKGHYTDCSELIPTILEFLDYPCFDGKSVNQAFDEIQFFASETA